MQSRLYETEILNHKRIIRNANGLCMVTYLLRDCMWEILLWDAQKPVIGYGVFTSYKMLLCMYLQFLLSYDTIKLPPFP